MTNIQSVENTFNLLTEGDRHIKLSTNKNIILVLGKTGSGKSTLTQYIAGDNQKLISSKVGGIYIIKDNNNRISDGTVSHTVFPELVEDVKTNTAYYDCPGFADNRDVSMDIASTYFIKKAIDDAKSVKIIFTVSYSATLRNNDRGEHFKSLLEHATSLIKNIDKYKNSISLVVTKVPYEVDVDDEGNFTLKTDNVIISSIANFLEILKPELKDVSQFKNNPKHYANAMILIDMLLTQEGENYQKIGIFRMPNKEGPISNMKLLQDGKQHILNIIQENTQFTTKDDEDFGYTVSDMSKNHIHDLVKGLNKQIASSLTKIGKEIQKYYHIKAEQSTDIHKLQNELNNEYNILAEIPKGNATLLTPEKLLTKIISGTNALKINVSQDSMNTLNRSNKYLNLFQVISDKPLDTKPLEWVDPLKDTVKYLHSLKNRYNFLADIYVKLSSYDIQKDTSRYNVANLEHWGLGGRTQGIKITQDNVRQFLNKLDQSNMRGYIDIKDIEIEESQLKALNDILHVTLKQKAQTLCSPDKLIVKGNYVKFSEISIDKCNKIKSMEIFALNTVFLDKDLVQVGNKLQFAIIAPKWHIIGTRKINLDGLPAEEYKLKASDAYDTEGRGSDGKPGLPGGSAGSFLGIGKEFINSQELTITANGGKGGSGQDGGDGGKGKDGETPKLPVNTDETTDAEKMWSQDKFVYNITKEEFTRQSLAYYSVTYIRTYYDVYGTNGTKGGNGGDGGFSGIGGNSGDVNIIGLYSDPEILVRNTKGQNGKDGIGGKGGVGGKNGDLLSIRYYYREHTASTTGNIHRSWVKMSQVLTGNFDSGEFGINGHNISGKQQPEVVKYENFSHTVNNYKNYLLEDLNTNVKKQTLTQFIDQLNSNDQVRGIYDTLGLMHELQSLENQFYRLKDEIEYLPFYQSLLSRISKYVTLPQDNEKSIQHKKVLNYLYTATLSKICSLKDGLESNLIIDIKEYLDSAISNINELSGIPNKIAIDKRNTEYKYAIDKKINEANDFIDKQIALEINSISEQIDKKIELLINETIELQGRAETEKHELIKKQQELENALPFKLMFNILKGVSQVVGFLGPWGQATSTILGTTSMVAESFILDDANQRKELVIPQGIKELLLATENIVHHIRDKKLKVLDQQLEILSQEKSEYPNQLADTIRVISNIKEKLIVSSNDDELDLRRISTLDSELKQQLASKEEELSTNKVTVDRKAQGALKVIKRLNQVSQVAEISDDIYLKYTNDQAKLNEISNAIKQTQDKLDQLKQYENNIYNTMIPIIKGMRDNINVLKHTIPSRSQVALDVAKWQIQSSIRDIKLQMQQFTKGFEIQENLARCIDKLDETMSTLINIYDRIQNYHEQKELADYIADISSVASDSIKINNVELSSAINNLELIIKSNIILEQYEIVINGFKQFIFPFADLYLAEFRLPSSLKLNSTQDLVFNAVKQIKKLQDKVIKMGTSITKHDKYMYKGDFHPFKYNTTKPFFVWENEKYKDTITKLLAGKEVSIKADILKGVNKNAIKFSLIEINFKSANDTIQNELDKILYHFDLQMTHLGNSYYRCNDNFYVITSDKQSINCSFAKNNKGEPIFINDVYTKIKDGDPMLSPYAMWSIKIFNENSNAFDQLAKYSNQVDLELVGRGQYVNNDYVCNRKLENYYKVDDTIVTNNVYPQQKVRTSIESHSHRRRRYHSEVGYHQSIRAINEDDDYITSNAAAGISAPLNNMINWVTNKLLLLKVLDPISYIQDWLTGGDKIKQSASNQGYEHLHYQDKYDGLMVEPTSFYRQVDSVLLLAPVIQYQWQKFFYNKVSENQDITPIDITASRVKTWQDFLDDAQEVVQILEEVLGSTQSEVREFADVLETRRADINTISNQIKVDAQTIEELEENFIAFQVDLQDDVRYNKGFTKLKCNEVFIKAMHKLMKDAEELPEYTRKLKLVKLNYSNCTKKDKEQIAFYKQLEDLIGLQEECINKTDIIDYRAWNIAKQQDVDIKGVGYEVL